MQSMLGGEILTALANAIILFPISDLGPECLPRLLSSCIDYKAIDCVDLTYFSCVTTGALGMKNPPWGGLYWVSSPVYGRLKPLLES